VIAIATGSISTLNFSLSQKDKDFLYQSGYDTTKKFFAGQPAGTNRFGSTPQTATEAAGPGQSDDQKPGA
jgi:hypothetical protein